MQGEDGPSGHAVDGHGTAVRGGDGLHDGEAQAGRAGGTGARRIAAGEPFEDAREQVLRDALAVVLDVHAQPRAAPLHARGDGRTGRCVGAGVGEQVDEDLLQTCRVGGHEGGLLGEFEAPYVVGSGGAGVADGVDDEGDEVGLRELERAARVEAGEQQQVLHEEGHPAGLGLDAAQRVPGVGSHLFASAAGEFGVPPDGGQGVLSSWLASATN